MVSAVDAPRCGESTSSPGARGTKHSDGVQSGCTPWMAALFSGPPLILVGCQLRAFEKTCADKVTMPAALAAYTERLFALPAVAKFKEGEKKAM